MKVTPEGFCAVKDTALYHELTHRLRMFFFEKGFLNVPTQSRLSILAACEDPTTVSTFGYLGNVWPLPQTGQMWLECELLDNQDRTDFFGKPVKGYICESTSYRNEQTPEEGRHLPIFPMFEFETYGGIKELMDMETELMEYLGFPTPARISYTEALAIVGKCIETGILDNRDEETLCELHGPVVLLYNFPERTSPFWNMRRDPTNPTLSLKVDVLMHGMETIGSAERATDTQLMKDTFYTISDGEYADLLFRKFGKDRTSQELNSFLSKKFVQRCGGGIGVTRMMRSFQMLMEEKAGSR